MAERTNIFFSLGSLAHFDNYPKQRRARMQSTMMAVGAAVGAYLLGSLSFAVIITKLMGQADPRTYGSKNPGATNVLRSGNKLAAILTLILDAAKGFIAVWLAKHFGLTDGIVAAVALAVFAGHLWPVFFKFAGGKGVATAAGVLLALNIWLGLLTLASWLVIVIFFRYVSLASLIAAAYAPFHYLLNEGGDMISLAIFIMSLLLIYRHRANIEKLIAGKESKIFEKK
jgi:acyl phosphate:glycerol-3-phosphate acyltransferase